MKKIFTAILFLITAACSTTGTNIDPYEKTNREIFEFNRKFDRAIMDPIANGYNKVVPKPVKSGISNALSNLREPMTFANDILQGKPGRAGKTLLRFVINSIIGFAGLLNPAQDMGFERHTEDIGQTLAVWGIKNPPYFVMPFIGSSTTRDTFGFGATFFLEPMDMFIQDQAGVEWVYLRLTADVVSFRADLDKVLDDLYGENDPYIIARSAYLQQRAFAIRDGKDAPFIEEDDDMFFDDEMDMEELAIYRQLMLEEQKRRNAEKKNAKK